MESKLTTVDNTIDIKEDITMTNQDTMITNTTYSEINFSDYFGTILHRYSIIPLESLRNI